MTEVGNVPIGVMWSKELDGTCGDSTKRLPYHDIKMKKIC